MKSVQAILQNYGDSASAGEIKGSNPQCKNQLSEDVQNESIYYGVYIPTENLILEEDAVVNVFMDKNEALNEVKKRKKARFKAFQSYIHAADFALYGCEYPNNNTSMNVSLPLKLSDVTPNVGEKPSQFRGPKSQEFVKLRKAIENGDLQFVKSAVWENPRFLISSGDTPAILQEGSRYNALHVAAKANNSEICDFILTTVGCLDFIQLLLGEENRKNSEACSKILLDLYLNMPEKGLNETPLHFAVKFGAADVVEVLVSYPQCDKTVLNKFSQMPKDIICSRVPDVSAELVRKIAGLLEDRYYVPVLRSEDNCVQPVIGNPFSPSSPPNLNTNPINPRVEIHAYAGPMKKEEASSFRKKWKTPPRNVGGACVTDAPGSPAARTPDRHMNPIFRLQDTEKGLERVGRDLAKQFNIGWKEYWPFLDTFADLSSKDGLDQVESFLKKCVQNAASESVINTKNKMQNSGDTHSSNRSQTSSVVSPITDLCREFEACSLSDSSFEHQPSKIINVVPRTKTAESILDAMPQSELSPYLCVEKSCQVFANRMSYHMLYLIESDTVNMFDALKSEVKHLKSLINSYMADDRFACIDFQQVHSRIAHNISYKIKEVLKFDDELDDKKSTLSNIRLKYNKKGDIFSSDDEEFNNHQRSSNSTNKKKTSHTKQVICLIENVLTYLMCEGNNSLNINTEEECMRVWSTAHKCGCVWKSCSNKSSRKSSLLKKNNYRYSNKGHNFRSMQNKYMDYVSRRLNFFEDDAGDDIKNESSDKAAQKNNSYNSTSSSSEDEYYTAATSVSPSTPESDSEFFEEPEENGLEVYIEGNIPTKMDYAVYMAIKDVEINQKDYPNIYRWRHSIMLYSEDERKSWPSPSVGHCRVSTCSPSYSVPRCPKGSFTPPLSWLRVTGQNSPMKSLRALRSNPVYVENSYYS